MYQLVDLKVSEYISKVSLDYLILQRIVISDESKFCLSNTSP